MSYNNRSLKDLKEIIDSLQKRISNSTSMQEDIVKANYRLNFQLETFNSIHKYIIDAFEIKNINDIYSLFLKGVVDIFHLEMSGIYQFDSLNKKLTLLSSYNLKPFIKDINCNSLWLDATYLDSSNQSSHIYSYNIPHPWSSLNLRELIFVPLFNKDGKFSKVIIGAISADNIYSPQIDSQLVPYPFTIYCKIMNGLINNIESIDNAKRASFSKSQFLANMSHEIRTPMNAIIGIAQIAQMTDDDDKIQSYISRILSSSHHLLSLINDILDISKIEEGKIKISHEKFNVLDLIDDVVGQVDLIIKAKSQQLLVSDYTSDIVCFYGDPMRITQVLINFLSNASKFSSNNKNIKLNTNLLQSSGNMGKLFFQVEDDGIGISPHFMDSLFTPFEQQDLGITKKYGGTGLGLAISEQLVKLMGSHIDVTSEVDNGSSFSFSLDLEIVKNDDLTKSNPSFKKEDSISLLKTKKILIVDDIDINRLIVMEMLSNFNFEFIETSNGSEALNIFLNSDKDELSLILMDVQMPIMDGNTATKKIRSSDHPSAKSIPIIAMSANVFKEDVDIMLSSGMNAHVDKPIDYNTLLNILNLYIKTS